MRRSLTSVRDDVQRWLGALQSAVSHGDVRTVADLFGDVCFWRDLILYTWNIRTMEGPEAIVAMLESQLPYIGAVSFTIDGEPEEADGIVSAWLNLETGVARGRGHLRLKAGKGFTLLTAMTELKGHEEKRGPAREKGIVHGAFKTRQTWLEQRTQEQNELGTVRQPYCVIIGGGQGGTALGARLKLLGVPTIILEKNHRAGDSWRNRYKSLVLHDPVWYDHLPYIPFPDHWPVFAPKDKIGDWLEAYAKLMELDYWGSSECVGASFDATAKEWAVQVRRSGRR